MRFRGLAALLALQAAAFGQAPQLVVLNKEGTVSFIDVATRRTVAKSKTGDGPHELVVTEDGKYAVVSNFDNGRTLSVIDTAAHKEVHRVDISPLSRPHGLFAADGKVYFTAEGSGAIGRYDPATNRVDWTLKSGQSGTHMILLSRDRSRIFTANTESGSVTIFQRPAGAGEDWRRTNVRVGNGSEGFDLAPDEKQLWVANGEDGTVSIVDVATAKAIATIKVGTVRSNRLKFTPDGKRVLVSDLGSGDLVILDVATRQVIQKIRVGHGLAGLLMDADGSHAYAAATNDNFVAVVDLVKLEVTGHIPTGRGPDGMDWLRPQAPANP